MGYSNFKIVISDLMDFMIASCEISLGWMPQNTFDDKWTLIQVMAWSCQAPEPMLTPYGFNRLQWDLVSYGLGPWVSKNPTMWWIQFLVIWYQEIFVHATIAANVTICIFFSKQVIYQGLMKLQSDQILSEAKWNYNQMLTHLPLGLHIHVNELGQHWFK